MEYIQAKFTVTSNICCMFNIPMLGFAFTELFYVSPYALSTFK